MAYIPDEEVEKVRQGTDIVQLVGEKVPLRRAGRHLKALCPFHTEKTPSFMVNPEKQIYHCFGCGEGGNVFSFVMKYEGLEFPEAVERLAGRLGIVLSRERGGTEERSRIRSEKELLYRLNQFAARYFSGLLQDPVKGKKARDYLESRQVKAETARLFGLGVAPAGGRDLVSALTQKGIPLEKAELVGLIRFRPDRQPFDFFRDRLLFPIVSLEGKVLGFSGRALGEGQPKYLNSPDSPIYIKGESFLGLSLARAEISARDQVVVVEGNFDQLRLFQEGVRNVVAPLGTALTERQIRLLSRHTQNFVLLFDGDEAGQKAARRALQVFLPMGLFPRAVTLAAGQDPDSFLLLRGMGELQALVQRAPDLLELEIERLLGSGGGSLAGKGKAVREVLAALVLVPGDVEKTIYIQEVARRASLSEELLMEQVLKMRRKGSNFLPSRVEEQGKARLPTVERTLLEILLAGPISPAEFFRDVKGSDFGSAALGELWERLRGEFESRKGLDVARLISLETSDERRGLLTELAMGASRWQGSSLGTLRECVARFRRDRYRQRLKAISGEIREAERAEDVVKVQELLRAKNEILREMAIRH